MRVCARGVILIDNVNCAGLFTHLPLHIRARVGAHDVSHDDDDDLNDAFICSETIKRTGNELYMDANRVQIKA